MKLKSIARCAAKGRYKTAISTAKQLLEESPEDGESGAWLAFCLLESGKTRRAVEQFTDSLAKTNTPRPIHPQFLRSLIQQRSKAAIAVHAMLREQFPAFAANYVSTSGDDPISKAYRSEFNTAAPNARTNPNLLIFNHLPFTGGTSIQASLSLAFHKNRFFNIKRRSGLPMIHRLNALSDEEFAALKYIHLHHPYPINNRGIAFARITVLRDPVSYFLSGYFKRRNLGKKIIGSRDMVEGDGGFDSAIDIAEKYRMRNGLARQLAVLHPRFAPAYARHYAVRRSLKHIVLKKEPKNPHLQYCEFEEDLFYPKATAKLSDPAVYELAKEVLESDFCDPCVIKHLEAGFLASMARLGHHVSPRIPHRGASHQPPREAIPDEVKARLRNLNQIDQRLYDETTAEFERKHNALIEALRGPL